MSQVTVIRQRAIQVSEQSKKAAGSLRAYRTRFDALISQIDSSIGGTNSGDDKQAISYLREVQKSVDDAVRSLEEAGHEAQQWANTTL